MKGSLGPGARSDHMPVHLCPSNQRCILGQTAIYGLPYEMGFSWAGANRRAPDEFPNVRAGVAGECAYRLPQQNLLAIDYVDNWADVRAWGRWVDGQRECSNRLRQGVSRPFSHRKTGIVCGLGDVREKVVSLLISELVDAVELLHRRRHRAYSGPTLLVLGIIPVVDGAVLAPLIRKGCEKVDSSHVCPNKKATRRWQSM